MAIGTTWTSPAEGGGLDLGTGGTVTETIWEEVMSDLNHIGGTAGLVWQSWTPLVYQGGAAIAGSANYAKFRTIGKSVRFQLGRFDLAGTGIAGSTVYIGGIPAALAIIAGGGTVGAGGLPLGIGIINLNGTSVYVGSVGAYGTGGTALSFVTHLGTGFGVGPAIGLTANDFLGFDAEWEIS